LNKVLPAPTVCLYTDKIRTRETIQELIHHFNPKTELKAELALRSYNETSQNFRARVQKLINYYTYQAAQPENKNQVIYACTHYDWVEEAMMVIESDKNLNSFEYAGWAPAQYMEFQITEDGTWVLKSRGAA
jgi:phosphohistidine phosphatase SixA